MARYYLSEYLAESPHGEASRIARACGVRPSAVHRWATGGRPRRDIRDLLERSTRGTIAASDWEVDVQTREIRSIEVGALTLREGAEIHEPTVEMISRSLDAEGLREPIVVTSGGVVLHGCHRLLAARRAGWTEIEAVTEPDIDGSYGVSTRESQVLAENLCRRHLPSDERTEALARLVELRRTIDLHKAGPSQKKPGRQSSPTRTAIREVAAETGVSEDTVERAVRRAKPEILASRAIDPHTADNQPSGIKGENHLALVERHLTSAHDASCDALMGCPDPVRARALEGLAEAIDVAVALLGELL